MTLEEAVVFLREALANEGVIRETKMFGGTGFMLNGNMIAGTFRQGLLVRVGKASQETALKMSGTSLMEMNGRVMEGYVYLERSSLDEGVARALLALAIPFVGRMPSKTKKPKSKRKGTSQ